MKNLTKERQKKYFLPVLLITGLLVTSDSTFAKAGEKAGKTKVKCHVELVGGIDIIHFGIIKAKRIENYAQWLIGKKIATGFSKEKQPIYKVKECVKLHDKFSSLASQQVDDNTAR